MRDSKGKKSFTTWRRWGVPLVAIVCCSGLAIGLYHLYRQGFQRLRGMKIKIQETETRMEKLKRENEEYAEKSQKLREPPAGDPLYIEEVARQNIGLVREGETVYHVQNSP